MDQYGNILNTRLKTVLKQILQLILKKKLSVLPLIVDILYNVHNVYGPMGCKILPLENSLDLGGNRQSTHTINRQKTLMDPIYIRLSVFMLQISGARSKKRRDIHISDIILVKNRDDEKKCLYISRALYKLERILKKILIFLNSWRDI